MRDPSTRPGSLDRGAVSGARTRARHCGRRWLGGLGGAILLALAGAADGAAESASADGWAALRALRSRLESQTQAADFVQEYVPAGFSSGDRETGRLTLALPRCLRWDYDEPFPKSYLLCEERVWTWNPGESSGRTFEIDAQEERGLDLLRLGVERLAERYTAELVGDPGAATSIRLEPLGPAAEISVATLTLSADGGGLAELSYRDVEGNTTRFEFGGQRPLAAGAADLSPPRELTWIED
jgi:outer membrane lipoprotein-sorting protein